MQFLDEAKLYIKSGDGGKGCMSFRREKFIPFGGPDGGDGGRGADIVVECVPGLNTLIDYRYKQHFRGRNGEHGKGENRSGLSRDPVILKVPVGTQIFAEDGETLIKDFTKEGEKLLLAKGGDGGFGNAHYKSSLNQAPRRVSEGWPGEEMWIWVRLKLISDVGLLGMPNAGKSTFLSRVSAAKPKIADYPFTTLKPQLGVASIDEKEFVVADIPGLIEDAHLGVGLGDKFLKHLERCKILLHLIDIGNDDICHSYDVIRHELGEYSALLAEKVELIVLNKTDILLDEEIEEKVKELSEHTGCKIHIMSAVTGNGVKEILRELSKIVHAAPNDSP